MSTFKIPPVYAETLFRMLDATTVVDNLTAEDVLRAHDWNFEGGTFGDRTGEDDAGLEVETATSGTVLPHGNSRDMANAMAAAREAAEDAGKDPNVDIPSSLREILRNRQAARRTSVKEANAWVTVFTHAVMDDATIVTGMPAVYLLADVIMNDCHYKKAFAGAKTKFRKVTRLAEELVIAAGAGAELSLTHTKQNAATAFAMMETYRIPEMTQAEKATKEMLATMTGLTAGPEMKEAVDELEDLDSIMDSLDDLDLPDFKSHVKVIGTTRLTVFPKCVVFKRGRKSYVLGMSDWRKVIILITGMKNYVAGCCADACSGGARKVAAASRTVSCVYMALRDSLKAGAALAVGEHIEMCKMYKAMLAVVKARISGERAAGHAAELLRDLKEMPVYAKCGEAVDKCLASLSGLTPRAALAAAKLFRLMPPPDVWLAEALLQRSIKAAVVHRISPEDIETFKGSLREVIATSMAFNKKEALELQNPDNPPFWWSSYKAGMLDLVPKSDILNHIKWKGKLSMSSRSRFDPSVWKDSALGQDTFKKAMEDRLSPHTRNMLKRMLFDADCPMPDEINAILEEISAVMLKPEGHKKRIAYMNNLASRLHQSLCELTVSDVMASHPAFAPVKTGAERDLAFEALSGPPPHTTTTPMDAAYPASFWVALLYSFDITGWSENMPLDIQVASHEVWDEFTGGDNFRKTTANHHKARVYCNNAGVKAWYTNGGANFEGYNGKEMTALHIAIMTLAVKELRRRLPDVPQHLLRIMLQAYIDDGIARMTVPSELAERVFEEWEKVVAETWARYGFKIEAKKSFPSYYYFDFLGEEYYAGTQLASGTKATMRILAEPPDYWETLPTRIAKIAASCRGASTAGMEPLGAIVIQALFSAMEVSAWVPIDDATATAFWMVAPRSTGGLGLPALIPQSANASGAAVEEGMANLREWVTRTNTPSVKKAYINLVRRGFRNRTSGEVLASPLGGSSEEGVMPANPLAATTKKGLDRLAKAGKLSPLGTVMTTLADREATEDFAEVVLGMDSSTIIQEAALADLNDGLLSPIGEAFVSRFEKESTFLEVSTRTQLRAIAKRNRVDAKASHAKMAKMAY